MDSSAAFRNQITWIKTEDDPLRGEEGEGYHLS